MNDMKKISTSAKETKKALKEANRQIDKIGEGRKVISETAILIILCFMFIGMILLLLNI